MTGRRDDAGPTGARNGHGRDRGVGRRRGRDGDGAVVGAAEAQDGEVAPVVGDAGAGQVRAPDHIANAEANRHRIAAAEGERRKRSVCREAGDRRLGRAEARRRRRVAMRGLDEVEVGRGAELARDRAFHAAPAVPEVAHLAVLTDLVRRVGGLPQVQRRRGAPQHAPAGCAGLGGDGGLGGGSHRAGRVELVAQRALHAFGERHSGLRMMLGSAPCPRAMKGSRQGYPW